MYTRQIFQDIMNYRPGGHVPVIHWSGWSETHERWHAEGLPRDVDVHQYFGTRPMWAGVGVHLGLMPAFETVVYETTDEYRIVRGGDGVVEQQWLRKSCIPHYMDFTLKTAADWPDYKRRLQPDPARIPADLDQRLRNAEASGLPVQAEAASMMGWIRNWMGVENMCYLMYDDRAVYADMVDTLSDLVCWGLDQVLPKMKVDFAHGWEDICGKAGPLVSPEIFRECVAPGYRKIRDKLESYGVKLYSIDSDGDVSALVGPWLDAGVNMQFPIEVGTWNGDANHYRREYGRDLRVFGNFDKLAIERGEEAIEAEFKRLMPLIREGGFIMLPDHLITPGVSLDAYKRFLDRWRKLSV